MGTFVIVVNHKEIIIAIYISFDIENNCFNLVIKSERHSE